MDRMIRKLDRSGEFLINVYEEGYDPEAPPKKKAATATTKVKAEKKTVTMDNVAEMDMKTMVMSGSVGKLTVDVLKAWLKSKGVVVGKQKKGELVDLVMAEFTCHCNCKGHTEPFCAKNALISSSRCDDGSITQWRKTGWG